MKYINLIIASLFALIYFSVNVPPTQKYNLWILTFAIPVVIAVNIVLFLLYALLRRVSAIFYLIPLLFSYHFIFSTYGVKRVFDKTTDVPDSTFNVLSYNVGGLKLPRGNDSFTFGPKQDKDSVTYKLKKWIIENESDIQCYQEFFDNKQNKYFNVVAEIKRKGYYCVFSSDAVDQHAPGVGVLIVSKFPIVKHGELMVSENGYNRTVFADVKVRQDTVRVINLHLESMEMKKFNPVYVDNTDSKKYRLRVILYKLKTGVFERSKQLREIVSFIDTSPYPVICVGDFNELPYSYAYHLMKKQLRNSFEEKGEGFGFTYNGKTLQTLRIDNQFYSSAVDIYDFKTVREVQYSDHFPLLGTYGVGVAED